MKKVVALLSMFFFVLFFFNDEVVAGGNEMNWTSFDEYGVAFSLPSRWKVSDLSQKNKPTKERKLVYFAYAKDKKNEVNFRFFAREEHWRKTLEEWVRGKHIPYILKRYSGKYGYSIKESVQKEISIGSGSTVTVEYLKVVINKNLREVAFIYFSHKDKYFYIAIMNNGTRAHIDKSYIVEKVFLPNLRLY